MKNKIKNISDLRDDMLGLYESARSGQTPVKEAKGIALVANTIVATARAQMEYRELTKSSSKIKFLES